MSGVVTLAMIGALHSATAGTAALRLQPADQGPSAQLWASEIQTYKARAEANAKKYNLSKIPAILSESATVSDDGKTFFVSIFDNSCIDATEAPKGVNEPEVPSIAKCPAKIALLTNGAPTLIATATVCIETKYDPDTDAFVEPEHKNSVSISDNRAAFHAKNCPEGSNTPISLKE